MEKSKKTQTFLTYRKRVSVKNYIFHPLRIVLCFSKKFLIYSLYSLRDPQRYEKPEDRVIDQYSLKKEM